jgi:S1-C subfamily serine protease
VRPIIRRLLLCLAVLLAPTFSPAAELADTIERIKPAIVVVGTHAKLRSPPFMMRGTGFAVGDGTLIATNAHVVPELTGEDAQAELAVLIRAGERLLPRTARLLIRDTDHDLALLRIDGPALPALPLRDSGAVREGQPVAFTGFPIGGVLGFAPVTHRGIVAAITPIAQPGGNAGELRDQSIQRLRQGAFPVFQLDATAYPGNSGGPLYDAATGEVIGVINMVFVKASKEAVLEKPSGISYAIPAKHLAELLAQAKR